MINERIKARITSVLTVVAQSPERVELLLSGDLDVKNTGHVWNETMALIDTHAPQHLMIDAAALDYCDGAGICFLIAVEERQKKSGKACTIRGLSEDVVHLKEVFQMTEPGDAGEKRGHANFFVKVGQATCKL
ncbi:MAG: STAS domain-containing protein, partial [Candidatus Omnitrophica bacterium]|nr:STAS domain-containing protein [Candidatus Omnitrophota bacterium]